MPKRKEYGEKGSSPSAICLHLKKSIKVPLNSFQTHFTDQILVTWNAYLKEIRKCTLLAFLGIVWFSQFLSMDMLVPYFLLLLERKFSRLYVCKARPGADNPAFAFLRVRLYIHIGLYYPLYYHL